MIPLKYKASLIKILKVQIRAMSPTDSLFAQVGASIMKRTPKFGVVQDRRFRAHFGVTPNVCSIAWQFVQSQRKLTIIPERFLWALMF